MLQIRSSSSRRPLSGASVTPLITVPVVTDHLVEGAQAIARIIAASDTA